MARSQKVFELAAGGDFEGFGILVGQDELRTFERQAVLHAGWFVFKDSRLWSICGKATRVGHRCRQISAEYLRVTLATSLRPQY